MGRTVYLPTNLPQKSTIHVRKSSSSMNPMGKRIDYLTHPKIYVDVHDFPVLTRRMSATSCEVKPAAVLEPSGTSAWRPDWNSGGRHGNQRVKNHG